MAFFSKKNQLLIIAASSILFSVTTWADVYVVQGFPHSSVSIFASESVGNVEPTRVIAGPSTGLNDPQFITVDTINKELYVSDPFAGIIHVFPVDADGDVAPLRTLVNGTNSQLGFPRKVALDHLNNEIIVPSINYSFPYPLDSSLLFYPRTANGDIAPLRAIRGESTQLDNPLDVLLIDDELITNSYDYSAPSPPYSPKIMTFPSTAFGDTAPTRSITGPTTTLHDYTNFLAYDQVKNEIYADGVFDESFFGNMGVVIFPRDGDGDLAPRRQITGPKTGINNPNSIVFDSVNRRVIVLHSVWDIREVPTIAVFKDTDDGDVLPIMTLTGPLTGLVLPTGIAIDDKGGFSSVGAAIHQIEDDFSAALVDPTALTTEDFEDGNSEPGNISICPEPANSKSNNTCFSPGDLASGFTLSSGSGAGLMLAGAGYFGNDTAAAGAVISGDTTVLTFDPPVTAVAMDLYRFSGKPTGRIGVTILNAEMQSQGYIALEPEDDATPIFLGIIGPAPIARVELKGIAGTAVVDNLRFGPAEGGADVIFADSFESSMLPSSNVVLSTN